MTGEMRNENTTIMMCSEMFISQLFPIMFDHSQDTHFALESKKKTLTSRVCIIDI